MAPMAFIKWMRQVNKILMDTIGLGYRDLRDRNWRIAFDDGLTPREAIEDLCGDPDNYEEFMHNELYG